jgi:hypothetical protein
MEGLEVKTRKTQNPELIAKYRSENPLATKKDAKEALNIGAMTIERYWNPTNENKTKTTFTLQKKVEVEVKPKQDMESLGAELVLAVQNVKRIKQLIAEFD